MRMLSLGYLFWCIVCVRDVVFLLIFKFDKQMNYLQVLHFNLYMPLGFILLSGIQMQSWLYMVVLVRKAIFKLVLLNTGLSKKMDGIWNRYNLKSTGRIYTFGILKCSEKFKVLDLP